MGVNYYSEIIDLECSCGAKFKAKLTGWTANLIFGYAWKFKIEPKSCPKCNYPIIIKDTPCGYAIDIEIICGNKVNKLPSDP